MAERVRVISGPRDKSFDSYIEALVDGGLFGVEHEYFGIADQDRADYIRRKMKTAGTHMDPRVAVRSFWKECTGCANGGPDCRYHVHYTIFDMDLARQYKQRVQQTAASGS